MKLNRRQLRKIILNEVRTLNETAWKEEYESLKLALEDMESSDWKQVVEELNNKHPHSSENLMLAKPKTKKQRRKMIEFFKAVGFAGDVEENLKSILNVKTSKPEDYVSYLLSDLYNLDYIRPGGTEIQDFTDAIVSVVPDAFTS